MPLYEEETKTLINEVMMLWENCLPPIYYLYPRSPKQSWYHSMGLGQILG